MQRIVLCALFVLSSFSPAYTQNQQVIHGAVADLHGLTLRMFGENFGRHTHAEIAAIPVQVISGSLRALLVEPPTAVHAEPKTDLLTMSRGVGERARGVFALTIGTVESGLQR
jgi:hypothetical protein